MKQKRLNSARS